MIDPLEVQVLNIVCGVRCVFSQHRCIKNIAHSGESGWQRQPVCHDTNPLRDLKCTYEPGAKLTPFCRTLSPFSGALPSREHVRPPQTRDPFFEF